MFFKYYIYISRENLILNIDILIDNSTGIEKKRNEQALLTTIRQKHAIKNVALQLTFYEWGLTLYIMKSILRSGWKGDFCFIYLFCLYPSFTECNIIILFIVHYFIFVMFCYILIKLLNHFLHHFFPLCFMCFLI